MKALIKKDEKIRARIGHLTSIITKSQEQTCPLFQKWWGFWDEKKG